jgi:hypothetical protein
MGAKDFGGDQPNANCEHDYEAAKDKQHNLPVIHDGRSIAVGVNPGGLRPKKARDKSAARAGMESTAGTVPSARRDAAVLIHKMSRFRA